MAESLREGTHHALVALVDRAREMVGQFAVDTQTVTVADDSGLDMVGDAAGVALAQLGGSQASLDSFKTVGHIVGLRYQHEVLAATLTEEVRAPEILLGAPAMEPTVSPGALAPLVKGLSWTRPIPASSGLQR